MCNKTNISASDIDMNRTTINGTNEDLKLVLDITLSPYVSYVTAALTGISVVINMFFVIVSFKVLKTNFHNLLVFSLCISDCVHGMSLFWFIISRLLPAMKVNYLSCLFTLFMFCFGLLLSYWFILLLCLERYLVAKSYNFGMKEKFNRIKVPLIGGVSVLSLLLSLSSFYIPHQTVIPVCGATIIYANYYSYFVFITCGTLTLLSLPIILITLLTICHIWTTFFKNRNIIVPHNSQRFLKRTPQFADNHQTEPRIHYLDDMHQSQRQLGQETIINSKQTKANERQQKRNSLIKSSVKQSVMQDNNTVEYNHNTVDIEDIKLNEFSVDHNKESEIKQRVQYNKLFIPDDESKPRSSASKADQKSWEIRALFTSVVIAITTVTLTGPIITSFWFELISDSLISYQSRMCVFILCIINTVINPFIYAWRISEIRLQIKLFFKIN